MNPNNHIFTSTYRVKWLKSKLTQTVKIDIDENNLKIDLIGQCIFKSWTCDGDKDCPSGADEANCTSSEETESPKYSAPFFPNATQCNEWTFRCNNGQCIPYWWKCDGTEDCSDKSDELECQDEKEVNIA